MSEQNTALLNTIDATVRDMQWGHSYWYKVYAALVILTVGLPGVAAMGLGGATGDRILAGGGALFAALLHALKPHEYATGYDAGYQIASKARASLIAGNIDEAAAGKEIGRAIDRVTFTYGIK